MMRNFFGSATEGQQTRENEIQVQVVVIDASRVHTGRGAVHRTRHARREGTEAQIKSKPNEAKPTCLPASQQWGAGALMMGKVRNNCR